MVAHVIELASGGRLVHIPNYLTPEESAELYKHVLENTQWEQDFYGNTPVPRLTAWFAFDNSMVYEYSKLRKVPQFFSDLVLFHLDFLSMKTGHEFNSCLINYYRDGNDAIGMHSDDEIYFKEADAIATISLGDSRTFRLRQKPPIVYSEEMDGVVYGKHDVILTDGSLIMMEGTTQRFWKHGIDREPGKGQRISLTFRNYTPAL